MMNPLALDPRHARDYKEQAHLPTRDEQEAAALKHQKDQVRRWAFYWRGIVWLAGIGIALALRRKR